MDKTFEAQWEEVHRLLRELSLRKNGGGWLSHQVPVARIWDNGWPDRINGRLNIWIGPREVSFPWDRMAPEDLWLNSDGTTNDEVTSQALDVSKPLNHAIRTVAHRDSFDLPLQARPGSPTPVLADIDAGGSQELWGWALPSGSGSAVVGGAPVPFGFTKGVLELSVSVPNATGNLRLGYAATGFREDTSTPSATESVNNTIVGPFAGMMYRIQFSSEIDLTLKDYLQVVVKRIATSGGLDTVNATIHIVRARIRRTA